MRAAVEVAHAGAPVRVSAAPAIGAAKSRGVAAGSDAASGSATTEAAAAAVPVRRSARWIVRVMMLLSRLPAGVRSESTAVPPTVPHVINLGRAGPGVLRARDETRDGEGDTGREATLVPG